MFDAPAVITVVLAGFALLATLHVWYAFGVAHVLAAHGSPSWRAWVPLLGEAELFRLGRVEPVRVVLYLVPVVSLYAVLLKIVVAHRIGSAYGRGAGTTLLAVLLPPVWATVLSGADLVSQQAEESEDDEAEMILVASAVAAPRSEDPALPEAAASLGQIAAPAGPGTISPSVFASGPASLTPPPAAPTSVVPGVSRAPEPGVPAAPAVAAPAASAPDAVAAPQASGSAPPVADPQVPGMRRRGRMATAEPPAPRAAASVEPSAPSAAASLDPAAPGAAAPLDEVTHIARSPRSWEIVLPTGEVVAVTARTIVLGRKPDGGETGVQYVRVDDTGRTVSKQHARLTWSREGWMIADLGSTNGVALLAADGSEQRVAADASVPVRAGFLLGDARLLVRPIAR